MESGLSADAFIMGKRDAGASAGFVRSCGNLSWRWQLDRLSALEKERYLRRPSSIITALSAAVVVCGRC